MDNFNLKGWLIEKKAGIYSKVRSEDFDVHGDENLNRGDLSEVDPAALGVGQAVADREMQKRDDENGDWVDNASMDVVAEEPDETVGYAMITKPADPLKRLGVGNMKKNP
jgi:hypothetical protein